MKKEAKDRKRSRFFLKVMNEQECNHSCHCAISLHQKVFG